MTDPRSVESLPGDQAKPLPPALPEKSAPTSGAACPSGATPDPSFGRRKRRRWVSVLVWASIAPFAAWAALRLIPADVHFEWIRAVAFTPYVALASATLPLFTLLTRRWAALVVSLTVAATLAACVLPRAVPGDPPAAGPRLRVLSANLKMGAVPPEKLVALVRELRPDVLTLQELTPSAAAGLRAAGIGALLPYGVDVSEPGAHGSGIYSRHPVAPGRHIRFGDFRQGVATVRVPGAPEVAVVSVHPCAPRYAEKGPCWAEGLAALPLPVPGGPVRILAGDFNATLDHARMRRLLDAGYRDAAAATGNGLTTTWPYEPWRFNGWSIPPVTLDHIFVAPDVATRSFGVHPLPRTDHRAVFAELTLPAR
ncbi:endonuclease/exonuclease/phosphatase family protein [Microtetraspora malaysiensis]|uniref:endonuclease/exonuclease/phosphatase family protein n=1 Tax=Microtetraspora malaysiensis TaxID=161358 RepID=UPI003D94771A